MTSTRDILSSIYQRNSVVAIEDFGDSSLVLHCADLRLIELNETARDLISRLDGQSTLGRVAAAMAEQYDQFPEAIEADAADIVMRLLELDIVEQVVPSSGDPNGVERPTII
jgi:hypothetical protein